MARDYIKFWSSKINDGGNFQASVIKGTLEECELATEAYLTANPGAFAVWENKIGYFLYDKTNLIGLLGVTSTHYSGFFASTWVFFQDGFKAIESPREEWSGGQ